VKPTGAMAGGGGKPAHAKEKTRRNAFLPTTLPNKLC